MLKYILAIVPSWIKIPILRLLGAKIGKNCYIGFSILDAKNLCMGDCIRIGNFNLIWKLNKLEIQSGARINSFNWISGAGTGEVILGKNSAITRFHYLEASANILLGNNSIIAGRSSHFYTHGLTPNCRDDHRPIVIGDWCYIGSSVRFVPGSAISDHTFVGMGSVVTKKIHESFVLIAGAPAIIRKSLSNTDAYFNRKYLDHDHHTADYIRSVTQ